MKMMKTLLLLTIIALMASCGSKSDLDLELIPVKSGSSWGYVNHKGEYVINSQFDSATPFYDGVAWVW